MEGNYVNKYMKDNEMVIKIIVMIFKIIAGIFIGAIIIPLKLLEMRVDVSDVEYIKVDINQDQI